MPRSSNTSFTTHSSVLSSLAGFARCASVFGTGGYGCGDSVPFSQMLDLTWMRWDHSVGTCFKDTLEWVGHICRDGVGGMEDVQLQWFGPLKLFSTNLGKSYLYEPVFVYSGMSSWNMFGLWKEILNFQHAKPF